MQPGQGIANRGYSLIQDCGHYSSDCGYCKEEGTTVSTGMHAHRLTVYDYQELLDQGWRRSGKFLYKPDNQTTCCRQYTIRLDVTEYQPTKAHRKLMRKWEQYLAGTHSHEQQAAQQLGTAPSRPTGGNCSSHGAGNVDQLDRQTASPKRARKDGSGAADQQQQHSSNQSKQQLDQIRSLLQAAVSELQNACSSGCDVNAQLLPAVRVLPVSQQLQQQHHKHKPAWPPGTVCTSPCALALAAAVRKHTSQGQQQQQQSAALSLQAGMNRISNSNNSSSSSSFWVQPEQLAQDLADRFNSLAANAQLAVAFTAAASKGHINFVQLQQQQQQQHQEDGSSAVQQDSDMQAQRVLQQHGRHQSSRNSAYKQVQKQHQDHQQQQQQQQQPHQLEVRMVPNQFIQEEFLLWQRYQAQQHHEALHDLTPKHYKAFLVDTPLIPVLPPPQPAAAAVVQAAAQAAGQQQQQQQLGAAPGMPSCGYGSFHQQYWLDGKLVAVGVVDVLPRCLSSKYFFWDPDYAWLSLGRYGALREISWVAAQHAAGAPDFRYYYLGFYIHTCPKMAYKAEYPPSELLCPKRQVWVRMDDTVRAAFDRAPYVVLSDLPGVQIRPNLSVPRQPPVAAAAAGQAGGQAAGAGGSVPPVVPQAQHMGLEQQVQQRLQERQALDSQLLFVMKQPVRWGALRTSGLLNEGDIGMLEEELSAWRAAVGETARTLLYATAQDMMSF